MSEIDWSKAPEGAEYYGRETEDFHESWYRKVGDEWYCWLLNGPNEWSLTRSNLEKRGMIEAPEPWTGTGLPPVGTVCEVEAFHVGRGEWKVVEVLAHAKHDEDDALLVCEIDHDGERADMHGIIYRPHYFRPISTQAQIEAEEREAKVQAMLEITTALHISNMREAMEELYDAGYRKQGEAK